MTTHNTEPTTPSDFSETMLLAATPAQVFDAITDVRGWWSEQIDGPTDHLGAEFEFHYKELHRSTHRITEFVPGQKIAWTTVRAAINFVADRGEWDATRIEFAIAPRPDGKTELRFTHVGLQPKLQCYGDCSGAWGYHLGSLRDLIATGKGYPNRATDADSYAEAK